jgi:hypothetical protein
MMFEQDKKGLFGFFKRTKVSSKDSLSDILERASESNNRSRKVFVKLGWMTKEGKLTEDAPKPIQDNYPAETRGHKL